MLLGRVASKQHVNESHMHGTTKHQSQGKVKPGTVLLS